MTETVHIVDDDASVRDSVRYLMESVGLTAKTYKSSIDFFNIYKDSGPSCLILDLRMPGGSGLEALEQIQRMKLTLPTIVMTGHGDVPAAVRAMKLGAVDFLEKPCNDHILLGKVQKAISGDAERRNRDKQQQTQSEQLATLSRREYEVMDLVVKGRSNKDVAGQLGVSPKTVESHRANVMRKLQVRSLAELVQLVLSTGNQEISHDH